MNSLEELAKQTILYSSFHIDAKERKDVLFFNNVLVIHQSLVEAGVLDLQCPAREISKKIKLSEKKGLLSKTDRDSFFMSVNSKDTARLIQHLLQTVDKTIVPFLSRILLQIITQVITPVTQVSGTVSDEVTIFAVQKKSILSGFEFDLTVITVGKRDESSLFGERHSYSGIKVEANNQCVVCL